MPALPDKLYKYRSFSVRTLRWITDAEVFYSPPREFNDPLDCDPTIDIDVNRSAMERLFYTMLCEKDTEAKAKSKIARLRYNATEIGDWAKPGEAQEYLKRMLAAGIKEELDRELGSVGVLSLSATWASAAMWSHYADEHRGVCIEYDTRDQNHPRLDSVSYTAPRAITTSDLIEWKIRGSGTARKIVCDTYFYAKSNEWKYEREWRDIGDTPGVASTPFRMTAILFGLRCDNAVITSMVKLLNENQDIKLWKIQPREESFKLRRVLIDRDEIEAHGIREPSFLMFNDIVWSDIELGGDDDLGVELPFAA